MSHIRWRLTLLALAATVSALYPITSLFTSDDWFGRAVATSAFVAALGVAMRALVRSRVVTLLAQLVVTTYVLLLYFAGETFAYWLPTMDTLERANSFGLTALETIQKHSAPAPLNDGVTFCLVVAAALVAVAVDATSTTWQSPAAAGLPLLTAYLVTAANGTEALRATFFIVPVLLWLTMLHVSARSRFGRWSTTSAREGDEADEVGQDRRALWALSAGAMRLSLLGVVFAMIVPVLLPHFPPRYLTDGLGRSTESGAARTVGFSDTLDLTQSLLSTDQTPVLRYSTTGGGRVPLRVTATSYFSRGDWLPERRSAVLSQLPPLPADGDRTDYVMSVNSNSLEPPWLAAPYPVVRVNVEAVRVDVDPVTRDVKVNGLARNYQVTYTDLAPTAAELRAASEPSARSVRGEDLALPDSSRALVTAWAKEVTAGADTRLDKAIAIQEHLRDTSRYTYNLDLGPQLRDAAGRVVEPVRTFYETRRGYCVQFATAMILMARAEGIPARMAIGFLPGNRNGSEYVVRASDAHAWPELYFEGYGWIRFEPTPAQRSGGRPAYTVEGSGDATGGGRAVDEQEPTPTASTPVRRPDIEGADAGSSGTPATWFGDVLTTRDVVTLTAVLVGLLATFLMPLTAWLVRVRRRRAASSRQELIEADWEELTERLRDLGLSPPQGGTLRQWRQHFVTAGHLDADNAEAMGRVTATLERARYDRPERTTPEQAVQLQRDVRAIRRNISRTRAWQARVRSYLWPSTGVDAWRRFPRLFGRRGQGTTSADD